MNDNVVHDFGRQKFVVRLSTKEEGVLLYEKLGEKLFDFYHTEVPPRLRGQGIGSKLARAAFDFILEEEAEVKLTCTFLQKFAAETLTKSELKHVKP